MKKKMDEGMTEFYKMFVAYIKATKSRRIEHFIQYLDDEVRIVFRDNLYQLFTFYLGEKKRVLLFTNLEKMYPVLREELLKLFKFLGFTIEDKLR